MNGCPHLERVELLPLLCGLADRLGHRSHLIEVTVLVDHACPACLADAGALEVALADLVAGVCNSMPGCRRAVSIDAQEGSPPNSPPRVKVRFAHHTATPTFETLAVVRAFAAHYNGSVDSHYRTPTGMTVSLCLPAPSEAHAASVQRQ